MRTDSQDGGSVVQQAQEKAQEVAGQAKDKAESAVRHQIDQRTSQTGIAIHSTAQDLRTVSQELRNQGKDTPARVAEQVAEKGEQLAGYLRTNDAGRILQDVEGFARRQPWAVIAGGLALGFVASRFLKSSSRRRYSSSSNGLQNTSTRSTDEIRSSLESGSTSGSVPSMPATPPPAPTTPVTPTPTAPPYSGSQTPGGEGSGAL